jgi:hypothetical protein
LVQVALDHQDFLPPHITVDQIVLHSRLLLLAEDMAVGAILDLVVMVDLEAAVEAVHQTYLEERVHQGKDIMVVLESKLITVGLSAVVVAVLAVQDLGILLVGMVDQVLLLQLQDLV